MEDSFVYVYIKYIPDNNWIYVAFEVPDTDGNENDQVEICLDFDFDRGIAPKTDDYDFIVTRTGVTGSFGGTGTEWVEKTYPDEWSLAVLDTAPGYSVEMRIHANVTDNQEMGILLIQTDFWIKDDTLWYNQGLYPLSATDSPTTWADIVFSKQSIDEISIELESYGVGEESTLTLMISPAFSTGTALFQVSRNGEPWTDISSGTLTDGISTSTWIPSVPGEYRFKALWSGDDMYGQVESGILTQRIKETSSLTISLLLETIVEEEITASGTLSPAQSGKSIHILRSTDMITYTKVGDAITDQNGIYTYDLSFPAVTDYYVKASWDGDENHFSVETDFLKVAVRERAACIIATSTYGSNLAPEVQFLRGFRDNAVLNTFAGSNFMTVFNAWYYSFSPRVASAIAANEALRGLMKILLYPLIRILHLAANIHSLLSSNQELAVVMSGLVASTLIGFIYFSPFTIISLITMRRLRRTWGKTRMLRLLVVSWLTSVILLLLGEISASSNVMMVASVMFVLINLSTSAIVTAIAVLRGFSFLQLSS